MKSFPEHLKKYIYAPPGYWTISPAEKARICNGCGAAGKRDYIPDSIFGLDISEICNIHDYMYFCGKKLSDKRDADQAFLDNLITLIDIETKHWIVRIFQRWLALRYFRAVKYFGGPAFWSGK